MRLLFCLFLLFCSPVIAAEPPPAPPLAAPAEPVAPKVEPLPIKTNILLQPWYVDQPSSGGSVSRNTFRIRRAEVRFSGSLSTEARWFVMIDPSKSLPNQDGLVSSKNDNKPLQDLGVAWTLADGWEAIAGQMKTPTMAEGLDSSGDLPLPERSLIGRTLGDKRLIGLQTSYRDTANKDAHWKFTAMLSNGTNANTEDSTNGKDLNFRGDFLPTRGFSIGGWFGMPDVGLRNFRDNHRWGVNLRWKGEKEFARYEHGQSKSVVEEVKKGSNGHTAEIGYLFWPKIQSVARFERFFPSSSKSANARAFTLGVNYLIKENSQKLQASYSFTKSMSGSNGSLASDPDAGNGRVLVIVFQMSI